MNYSFNGIYSRIRTAVLSENAEAYVTSRYVPKPPRFPCVYIREINRSRPVENIQLDGEDRQWESNIEIQVTSNKSSGAAAEAEGIYTAADNVMRSLFYRGISCTPIDNGINYTLAARYRRVIGGGDQMPE